MTYRTTNLRLRKVAVIRYSGNFFHVSLKETDITNSFAQFWNFSLLTCQNYL